MGRKRQEREVAAAAEDVVSTGHGSISLPPAVPSHRHQGIMEEVAHLRSTLGRVSHRLASIDAALRQHTHEETGPPVRMGVHVDEDGNYFMRRPDGWHVMVTLIRTQAPRGRVQRLAEPKE